MNIIPTDRIDLIPATPEFVESLIAHEYARAGNLLNAVVPAGWPHDEAARIGSPFIYKLCARMRANSCGGFG